MLRFLVHSSRSFLFGIVLIPYLEV
jgi:hypothetical protein